MGLEDSFHEGLKAYRDGRYQEAIQLLYEAVADNEKNHKAWNALGVTFSKLGRFEDALNCYENALKYDPGNLSYEQNKDQIVEKAFRQITPTEPEPRVEIGTNYRKYLIPSVMLIFVAVLGIYIIFVSSFFGGTHIASPSPPLTPVPTITVEETASSTSGSSGLSSNLSTISAPTTETANQSARSDTSTPQPTLIISGDLTGKYANGLSELTFPIRLSEGSMPQYLPRVTYLWSVGSLDPINVLPANPASGTIKPGENQEVTLQIPLEQQPRAGEKFSLEIRSPTGSPAIYNGTLPADYRGGIIANPSPAYPGALPIPVDSSGESAGSEITTSNLATEGALNGYYSNELEELTLTLREQATGSPQDMTRISYLLSVGDGTPVKISNIQPSSGTINPGEQQLVTLYIPEGSRPRAGDTFTLEIKPDSGTSIQIRKALSSAYKGGVIP